MFKSAAGRVSHFRSQHGQIPEKSQRPPGGRLECPHCTETFSKGSGLSSHMASRHGRHVGSGAGAGAAAVDDNDDGGVGENIGPEGVNVDGGAYGIGGGDYIQADDDEVSSLSSRSGTSCSSSSSRHRSSSDTNSSGSGGGGGSDDDKSSKHSQASSSSSSSDGASTLSDDEKKDDKEEDVNSSEDCVCDADEALFPDVANAETR